jgi:hypothetical protein
MLFPRYCILCGRTDYPLEDHHTINLAYRTKELNNHPLNLCRICSFHPDSCHETVGDIHTPMNEFECLKATYLYLKRIGYKFDEEAMRFIKLNKDFYAFVQGIKT